MPHFKRTLLFAIFALLFAPHQAVKAQGIAAVVNNQIISDFDVTQRQRLIALSGQRGASRQMAIDELVEERLKNQEARKLGVKIQDAQVDTAFNSIAQRTKMTPDIFVKALASRGVEPKTLKDRLRAEMAWQQVVQIKGVKIAAIRDQDVVDALKKQGKDPDKLKSFEFTVVQVVVFAPKGSSAAAIADKRRQAEVFRGNVNGCEGIKQRAQGFRDTAARDPVKRSANDMPPALKQMLENTPVGKATPVQQSDNGFEFIIVCGRQEISGRESASLQMKQELMQKEAGETSKRLLTELKQKAQIDIRK